MVSIGRMGGAGGSIGICCMGRGMGGAGGSIGICCANCDMGRPICCIGICIMEAAIIGMAMDAIGAPVPESAAKRLGQILSEPRPARRPPLR